MQRERARKPASAHVPTNDRAALPGRTSLSSQLPAGPAPAAAPPATAPSLWAKGPDGAPLPPSLADIRQQLNDDCYLFAAMAAIVTTDPQAIRAMITVNGDDTYTVTLAGPLRPTAQAGGAKPAPQPAAAPTTVTVAWNKDGKRDYAAADYPALWPLILEKAFAQLYGADAMSFGNPGRATATLTGKAHYVYRPAMMPVDEIMQVVTAAHAEQTPMTIGMKAGPGGAEGGMFPGKPGFWQRHGYAIVDVDAAGQRIKLFNPKPADRAADTHPHGTGWVSVAEFKEYVLELDVNR